MCLEGEPIESIPVRSAIYTGIAYERDPRVLCGMVSEYEEREVAVASGYSWPAWQREDSRNRAAAVAWHRVRSLISMHTQDAIDRELKLRQQSLPGGE